jgi:teichuronic acid biosynthesis glycosyltransferase TuaG
MIEVSIIMPAYNAEKYIAESIKSVIDQTFKNWELIIIDDGSTDNTKVVVAQYAQNDNRIKYFWQKNGRQGKARNLGLANAKGELIAFLDADDKWEKEKLTIQFELIRNKGVDLVFSNCYLFDGQYVFESTNVSKGLYGGNDAVKAFILNNQIGILTVLCKKSVIERVKGFPEQLDIQNAEDYHLWLRLLLAGCTFYTDDRVLAGYRQHADAMTNDDKTATLPSVSALLDVAEHHLEWKSLIRASVIDKLKKYLYHYKIDNRKKAKHLLRNIRQLRHSPLVIRFLEFVYDTAGEKIFRKIILKYL